MNFLSIFKEASGDWSMRRVLAALLSLAALGLFVQALALGRPGWTPYLPGALCLGSALLLLFFTTWGDVVQVVNAWKGMTSTGSTLAGGK